jgi:hypothetical protein
MQTGTSVMWGICSVSFVLRKWAFLGGCDLGWSALNKECIPGTPFLVQSIDGFQWQKAWRASQKEADLKSVKIEAFCSSKSRDFNGNLPPVTVKKVVFFCEKARFCNKGA